MKSHEGLYFHHADGTGGIEYDHKRLHKNVDASLLDLESIVTDESRREELEPARDNFRILLAQLNESALVTAGNRFTHREVIVNRVNDILPPDMSFYVSQSPMFKCDPSD